MISQHVCQKWMLCAIKHIRLYSMLRNFNISLLDTVLFEELFLFMFHCSCAHLFLCELVWALEPKTKQNKQINKQNPKINSRGLLIYVARLWESQWITWSMCWSLGHERKLVLLQQTTVTVAMAALQYIAPLEPQIYGTKGQGQIDLRTLFSWWQLSF